MRSEAVCEDILRQYSWRYAFNTLPSADEGEMDALCAYMEKLARSPAALKALEELINEDAYVEGGFRYPHARVREMTCALVQMLLEKARSLDGFKARVETWLASLMLLFRDDTLTSSENARKALLAICTRMPECAQSVIDAVSRDVFTDEEMVPRARGVCILQDLMKFGDEIAQSVFNSGYIERLVADIERDKHDELASCVALENLALLAEKYPAAVSLFTSRGVADALLRITKHTDTDPAVRAISIGICGRVAGATIDAADGLVLKMCDMFSEFFETGERSLRSSVFDALGQMCTKSKALTVNVVPKLATIIDSIAYGAFKGTGDAQMSALCSLANICGVARGDDATVLDDVCEEIIKNACFDACGKNSTIEDRVYAVLAVKASHFDEQRCQMYRLITALAKRDWFANAVANHVALRKDLCFEPERNSQARDLRIAALRALSTANIPNTLARDEFALAVSSRFTNMRSVAAAIPDVATAHR